MSEAPERIWASLSDERFDNVAFHGGWSSETSEYHPYEYVRADRIEELEAKLAMALADMKSLTDVSTLMQSSSSHNRFRHNTTVTDSIWSQWSTQLKFARKTIAELTGGKDE